MPALLFTRGTPASLLVPSFCNCDGITAEYAKYVEGRWNRIMAGQNHSFYQLTKKPAGRAGRKMWGRKIREY